jgi:hypothetical protein
VEDRKLVSDAIIALLPAMVDFFLYGSHRVK